MSGTESATPALGEPTAFLPATDEGVEVGLLLRIAFDRRLVFQVGTSLTTGKKNTVVWTSIHHKTNLTGGSSCFGWPDATYFNRVTHELAANGVFAAQIRQEDRHELKQLIARSASPFEKPLRKLK